jgi:hypothetical protein
MEYKISRVPKGNGLYREIYIASDAYKQKLLSFLPYLNEVLDNLDVHKTNYAFQRNKNCALNAFQHIGYRFTLSMDLEDFFGSITLEHVDGLIDPIIIEQCFIDGNPKQGLPTSPVISSIAFLACDTKIIEALNKLKIDSKYTRYADDLIFSFDDEKHEGKIRHIVRQIIEKNGFRINDKKTKLQDSSNGRVIITGIAVDKKGLHATRRTQKKIRAARHQNNASSLNGLIEWSKCKLPNNSYF